MTETTAVLCTADVMDAALAGFEVDIVDSSGRVHSLDVNRWLRLGLADCELFVTPCDGMTIDVGCGPGRLTEALAQNGNFAIGIDISAGAVRRARSRGAIALQRDVFGLVPGAGKWDHALLADGNVGIGGDPVRLLRRTGELIRFGGTVVVEVGPPGTGLVQERLRFRVGEHVTDKMDWSFVGVDAIAALAGSAGMRVERVDKLGGRHTAILCHQEPELLPS